MDTSQIGYKINNEMIGVEKFCPFNGALTITMMELTATCVKYSVAFANGRKKDGTKSFEEAEALGWIISLEEE